MWSLYLRRCSCTFLVGKKKAIGVLPGFERFPVASECADVGVSTQLERPHW